MRVGLEDGGLGSFGVIWTLPSSLLPKPGKEDGGYEVHVGGICSKRQAR